MKLSHLASTVDQIAVVPVLEKAPQTDTPTNNSGEDVVYGHLSPSDKSFASAHLKVLRKIDPELYTKIINLG